MMSQKAEGMTALLKLLMLLNRAGKAVLTLCRTRWPASVVPTNLVPMLTPSGSWQARYSRPELSIEPDVLHAPAVEAAVGHRHQVLEAGLLAARKSGIKQHRARSVGGQTALDLP